MICQINLGTIRETIVGEKQMKTNTSLRFLWKIGFLFKDLMKCLKWVGYITSQNSTPDFSQKFHIKQKRATSWLSNDHVNAACTICICFGYWTLAENTRYLLNFVYSWENSMVTMWPAQERCGSFCVWWFCGEIEVEFYTCNDSLGNSCESVGLHQKCDLGCVCTEGYSSQNGSSRPE